MTQALVADAGAKLSLCVRLPGSAEQQRRLLDLRKLFTEACNALAPMVQQTRCWNRVALHHMAYKPLRERFPQLGSQMACNVIYSVSRAARHVYQHHTSPYNVARNDTKPLPMLRFDGPVPVYFDRHTLSLKDGAVSLFTLDGRMRFQVDLSPDIERRFREDKLREIVLAQGPNGEWALTFDFAPENEPDSPSTDPDWPQYLVVSSAAAT
ncbi:MAG: hypothetical protein IH627_14565 [Rubrivivax sp.]|nr:hypothetical protein [Rubrivivax sp.]